MPDRQVEALRRQRGEPVGQIEFEPHLGMGAQELRQQRHQLLARQRHRRGDAQQPARHAGQVAHAGIAVRDALERQPVSSTSRWPASVSRTLRVVRRTSAMPAARSSSAMRWLIAALLTPSRAAAAV